jgi:hypothetical protein
MEGGNKEDKDVTSAENSVLSQPPKARRRREKKSDGDSNAKTGMELTSVYPHSGSEPFDADLESHSGGIQYADNPMH